MVNKENVMNFLNNQLIPAKYDVDVSRDYENEEELRYNLGWLDCIIFIKSRIEKDLKDEY